MAASGFPSNAQHQHQHQHPQLYQQHPLRVDTKPSQAQNFFENDDSVLDEGILDSSAIDSGLELSPHMADSRRESVALGGMTPFSPTTTKVEDWQSVDMQSVPSNNPLYDQPQQQQSNNPFQQQQQPGHFAAPANNMWSFQGQQDTSDFSTADNSFFMMPGQMPLGLHRNMFEHLDAQGHQGQSFPSQSGNGLPLRNGKTAQQINQALRSKGDGIRKKNARFDIPPEHHLGNIDELISKEKCEKKIKELKGHKRLLRNRQAALDSRQRKKQHTERLEDEKKQYSEVVSQQEHEIETLRASMEAMMMEKQQYMEYIHRLQMEKDDMIATHTNETGELRRKITVLSDSVRRLESSSNSAASNPNEYDFADMPDLPMGSGWDHSTFIHDFPVDMEPKQDMAVVKKESVDGDKSTSQQGGLLFMLFLVGAFVLSNKSAAPIPRVSDDVRVASATLLDNVLKDAGLGGTQTSSMQQPLPSQPTGSWSDPATSIPLNDMGMDHSGLGDLGNSLTQPTEEQNNEQLFSLSAADYNGVSNPDFLNNAPPAQRTPSQGRRNLNDALAALRVSGGKVKGAADVYTRTLLWDQIPSDIVRDFAKMVAESNAHRNDNL